MRHYISLALFSMAMLLVSSCSNDAIDVEKKDQTYPVSLTVSLNDFFSCYNFNDTKHPSVKIADEYRVFNSEKKKFIQVRTLFYNQESGELVDSLISYSPNTNAVSESIKLPLGKYCVISTLAFADKESNEYAWWDLADKENLATVKMIPYTRYSYWALLSVASKEIIVTENSEPVNLTPTPIGSLAYIFYENFQYQDEISYGTIADNGIRTLGLYSQKVASAYYLNPNAMVKYDYYEDAGRSRWWFLSDNLEPTNFNESWTFFKSNLYDYCYILAPEFNLTFGYKMQGANGFTSCGMNNYSIQNGKMYLAYWDWFKVGNPYFGPADNNHWNTYTKNSVAEKPACSPIFNVNK